MKPDSSFPCLKGLTFSIQTFGCQMNKHDSERIAGELLACGMEQVKSIEEADVVVFITCCVRESAESRLFGHVSSIKNTALPASSPLTKRVIAIGGCIGQRDGEGLLKRLPHVDVVFGTHNIESLPALLERTLQSEDHVAQTLDASSSFPTDLPLSRESAYAAWLPITIGCDNFCTYCIVPYVRGREKSRPQEDIVAEARTLIADGVKEITLLGQNVNSYGRDLYGAPRFAEILKAVSDTGIDRLRFATSHPKDLTSEVIKLFGALPNLMPALHLPVQSGSNRILERMNRHYTKDHYLHLIDQLRTACPDIALSTDIIVGFPGETEQDFQDTYDLIERVGYSQVFTFKYSPRSGTRAASMPERVPSDVVQRRFDGLLKIVEDHAHMNNAKELDAQVQILVEGTSKKNKGVLVGKTPKNQTVHALLEPEMDIEEIRGKYLDIHITEPKTWYLFGEITSDPYE